MVLEPNGTVSALPVFRRAGPKAIVIDRGVLVYYFSSTSALSSWSAQARRGFKRIPGWRIIEHHQLPERLAYINALSGVSDMRACSSRSGNWWCAQRPPAAGNIPCHMDPYLLGPKERERIWARVRRLTRCTRIQRNNQIPHIGSTSSFGTSTPGPQPRALEDRSLLARFASRSLGHTKLTIRFAPCKVS